MSKKIVITKGGYNALTETDPNNFIFNSDYNTFKILAEGTLLSQSVTASPTTFSVAHGQSITPAVFAFIQFPDGYVALPNEKERADAIPVDRYWIVEVDATNIYFMCYKGSLANYSVDIKYFIFETPL